MTRCASTRKTIMSKTSHIIKSLLVYRLGWPPFSISVAARGRAGFDSPVENSFWNFWVNFVFAQPTPLTCSWQADFSGKVVSWYS